MERPKPRQLRKNEQRWQECSIRQKITFYMVTVFLCTFLSVLFNIWVADFTLGDFDNILSESSKSNSLLQAVEPLYEKYCRKHMDLIQQIQELK
jgi:hypothetical protein